MLWQKRPHSRHLAPSIGPLYPLLGHFCHEFFGRFFLHDVISVADFSDVFVCTKLFLSDFLDVSVCTSLFLSWIFRTFQFARSFCCGFFGRFSLRDVIFVADFSDVSVCTMLFFFARFNLHVIFFGHFSLHDVIFVADFSR